MNSIDYQLDEEKMYDLHTKLKSIADPTTGRITVERLEEYKFDKTLMDFVHIVLSYLPKVEKDLIGLDEERCNR